ncbi:MAG: flagellar hook-associated protein FlgL [Comamonas sp.]|nr:flagellar hook-associated protein FlgL [Comamonas sp.]
MANVNRYSTATMYANTVNMLSKQQKELADQIEHVSAKKKVLRASDDPVGAAQAERARTRLSRLDTDQRALDAQTATITYGESTLGEMVDALQSFRDLTVQAGNGSFTQTERDALVQQMESLRNQILGYANRKDSNGLPLFRGLDSQEQVISGKYQYDGQAGQQSSSDYGIASTLDGALAFMSGSTGNGVLAVELGVEVTPATTPPTYTPNTGKAWSNVGTIKDPSAAAAFVGPQTIQFAVDATGKTTYSVVDSAGNPVNDTAGNPMTNLAYKSGDAIRVGGMDLAITGVPANGDGFTVKQSERTDLFSVLDSAIAASRNSGKMDGTTAFGELAHGLAKVQAEIDTAMNRVSTVRSYAGDLMQQSDRIGKTLLARNEQMEGQRAAAEDMNDSEYIAALSLLQNQQLTVSAAMQSYASIQKLSLFNFIN